MDKQQLVEAVKAHALKNYERGWDLVVETMSDEDITEHIGRATTVEGALDKLSPIVSAWREIGRERQVGEW